MKILYVEDELTKNIARLLRLFANYLDEEAITKLKSWEADEYGATSDDIKRIIKTTNIIEIEDSFPDAMRKIVQGYDKYACFIVDRNLIENSYNFGEVNIIDQNYTEVLHMEYKEREGDYLLNWLGNNAKDPKSTLQKFNFLSAYPAGDIRGVEKIKTYIDFGTFTQEQFFDKSDQAAIEKLKGKLDNITVLNIKYENRKYLDILRHNLNEADAVNFLNVLLTKDDESLFIDNLKIIRNLIDAILKKLEKIIPHMRETCSGFGRRKTIDWLGGESYANGREKHMDSIRQNFSKNIWIISSDVIHDLVVPTANTINSLVYALKDVILWFGDRCNTQ